MIGLSAGIWTASLPSESIFDSGLLIDGGFEAPDPLTNWTRQDFQMTLGHDSGRLKVTLNAASTYFHQAFPTTIGNDYLVEMEGWLDSNVTNLMMQVRDGANSGWIKNSSNLTSDGSLSVQFTATDTSHTIRFTTNKSATPAISFWDNIKATEV